MMSASRHLRQRLRICSDLDGMSRTMQPVTVLYFVISEFKGARYVVERETQHMTREATLQGLRTGDLSDVVTIIETEFTDHGLSSRDVTDDMLAEAEQLRQQDREPIMSALDRLIAQLDHDRDHAKNWRA